MCPSSNLFLLVILIYSVMGIFFFFGNLELESMHAVVPTLPDQRTSMMERRLGNRVFKDSFNADEYVNLTFLLSGTCKRVFTLFPLILVYEVAFLLRCSLHQSC